MFRIVISIYRGTCAGRALSLMANGLQVSADTLDGAFKHYDAYLEAASVVLHGVEDGHVFGLIAIIDETTGTIANSRVLKR